ncbi:hypothetical protein ACFL35_21330 [Candidatus Riflebacteria bacterium]
MRKDNILLNISIVLLWMVLPALYIYIRDGEVSGMSRPDTIAFSIMIMGSFVHSAVLTLEDQSKGKEKLKNYFITTGVFCLFICVLFALGVAMQILVRNLGFG